MRQTSLLRHLLGSDHTVIEAVTVTESEVVIDARPDARRAHRCGRCGRRSPVYDHRGTRLWRALDLGTTRLFARAPRERVHCRVHGVVAAGVPWARHGARHTHAFEQQTAWLAVHADKTTVTELMRISWRTVGAIVERVVQDATGGVDRLDGLRRIGIDELSYRKHHKYLVVVVDHDTGRLVYAAPGRDRAAMTTFFDALGPERTAQLTHVSADSADWISEIVTARAPQAIQCADPFHMVAWANDALNAVRIGSWRRARAAAQATRAGTSNRLGRNAKAGPRKLKNTRFALLKNPTRLTTTQQASLDWISRNDSTLWRAYQLKEAFRLVFSLKGDEGIAALDRWLSWAARCRIPEMVHLQRRVRNHYQRIVNALTHGLSNALAESTNAKARLITRRAYGFHSHGPLIALMTLSLGHTKPVLPGRK